MKIIAFSNKKGGVGKTSSTLCTAAYLGIRGKKVLAIDMDSQSNFTYASKGEPNVQGVFDFMKGAPLRDVLQNSEHYDFIGADLRLSKADSEFEDIGKEFILRNRLKTVKNYDYILIDTPPSMGILTLNALAASNEVVICCQCDGFSLHGLSEMKKNISGVKEYYNSDLNVAGILMTRYNPRTALTKNLSEIFAKAAKTMNTKVFENYIRENTSIRESQVMQTDLFSHAPHSNGALDYTAFIHEYLGSDL